MPLTPCRTAFTAATLLLSLAATSFAQDPQPPNPQAPSPTMAAPAPAPAAVPESPKPPQYLPLCSTEKVNRDCFLNIDRRYPISMPTFQMNKGAHITVYVFHPLPFESLTLDPGTAQAFESTDQAAGLVNALSPLAKGAQMGTVEVRLAAAGSSPDFSLALSKIYPTSREGSKGEVSKQNEYVLLANDARDELIKLDSLLTQALDSVTTYISETKNIYNQVREIESPVPRPAKDRDNSVLRYPGVETPPVTPWDDYPGWKQFMIDELKDQGDRTTKLLARLPGPCQKTDPQPVVGPWLAPGRKCKDDSVPTQNSDDPLAIPKGYDDLHATLEEKLTKLSKKLTELSQNKPDKDTYDGLLLLKKQLETRHQRVSDAITLALDLLPAMIAKTTTDMESVFTNIYMAPDTVTNPTLVGVIYGPDSLKRTKDEKKILAPYKALGPQIIYTLNAQNEIANSLQTLPTATQKQPVVTITALYAAPRFEVSAGAFLSWLSNRTFANKTDVTIKNGVPTPVDVKIDMTKTIPPLVIPFAAANYRISPEYNWLGGRRNAFYATLGVGLNPYDTQVEYVGGFSFSWRYLMFSPLYHLGHGTHLTQGEQVGQIWCVYGAAAGANPPPCGGGPPPSPTTKTYWTGAFAIGVSVRIPTTFSSTNH